MWFARKTKRKTYDPTKKKPMIRVSICTGEKVAGFRDLQNGKFEEVMLILGPKDLEEFKDTYGIEGEIGTFY